MCAQIPNAQSCLIKFKKIINKVCQQKFNKKQTLSLLVCTMWVAGIFNLHLKILKLTDDQAN